MEPKNRPYVDPATEPGDAGTEPWAGDPDSAAEDQNKRRAPMDPVAPLDEGTAIDGSSADIFMTEDAISARNEDPGKPAS